MIFGEMGGGGGGILKHIEKNASGYESGAIQLCGLGISILNFGYV